MIREHFYFKDKNGHLYEDFTLYHTGRYFTGEGITIDSNIEHELNTITARLGCTKLPKGTSIYVAPGSKYAAADIRKYYSVKRAPDTGDYNILNNVLTGRRWSYWERFANLEYYPEHKIAVAYDLMDANYVDMRAKMQPIQEAPGRLSNVTLCAVKLHPVYIDYIRGALTKPCVSEESLDLNSDNEVTLDLLKLIWITGNSTGRRDEAVKNLTIQLQALNQHNWRDYKGTVSMLKQMLRKLGPMNELMRRPSQQPKPLREILGSSQTHFSSDKDRLLGQKFIQELWGLDTVKFCTFYDLVKKIDEISLPYYFFDALFDNCVRLTPKKLNE